VPTKKALYRHKVGLIDRSECEKSDTLYTALPEGYWWTDFDVDDNAQIDEVCEFLKYNYMSAGNDYIRVQCEREKFKWAVKSPGFIKDLFF
jgi:hypothetical protein